MLYKGLLFCRKLNVPKILSKQVFLESGFFDNLDTFFSNFYNFKPAWSHYCYNYSYIRLHDAIMVHILLRNKKLCRVDTNLASTCPRASRPLKLTGQRPFPTQKMKQSSNSLHQASFWTEKWKKSNESRKVIISEEKIRNDFYT